MYGVVAENGDVIEVYSNEQVALLNAPPGTVVLPVPPSMNYRACRYDWAEMFFVPIDTMTAHDVAMTSPDHRARRAFLYGQELDRILVNEVLLDIALAAAEDPVIFGSLRKSTQDKLLLVKSTVDTIKAAHPPGDEGLA